MKAALALLCTLSLFAAPVLAQSKKEEKKAPAAAQKKQQERMRDCNRQAGDKALKGEERKKFMSTCRKG